MGVSIGLLSCSRKKKQEEETMGLKLFSCGKDMKGSLVVITPATQVSPNPDPYKFFVEKSERIGNNTILLVHYFGCTTFDGRKLLLINIPWDDRPELDPHFLDGNHIVKARFEPTEEGYKLAKLCAENLGK